MSATAAAIDRSLLLTCALQDARDLTEAGNKAFNLCQMLALGFNVPPGFVVTNTAFRLFLDANRIEPDARFKPPDLDRASVPKAILEEVLAQRDALLSAGPLVIRSSAVGEDGADASFAGQLDSILHVETAAELEHALLACWSSYWNERVLSYQAAKGVQLKGMAVIVQSQARSRVSGVLFTESAVISNASRCDAYDRRHSRDRICVEYCAGLGDALVSGRVNPGRFQVSKTDYQWTIDSAGDLDPDTEARLFNPHQIARLAQAADRLQKHFGRPQDIEWTIDDRGDLLLLQSRPISVQAGRDSSRQILWSNANVNENFPTPISPFLYSIAREGYCHYFRNLAVAFGLSRRRIRAMEPALRYLVGVHHSRIYYNLTNIHSVLRMAPFGEELAKFFNDFVGADAMDDSAKAPEAARWMQALEAARIAIKTTWQFAFLTRRVEAFEHCVDDWVREEKWATTPFFLQLRDQLRGFMEIRCHRWTNASLADAASMICYGVLKVLLRSAYPGDGESALHNNLLKGLGGVVSVQPALELWQLSRKILVHPELAHWLANTENADILNALQADSQRQWLDEQLMAYLKQWGFRFSGELMLTVPSLDENPSPLLDMLKTYLKAKGTAPIDSIRQLESEQAAATSRVLDDLRKTKRIRGVPRPLQAPLVSLVLRATRRAIRLRERARAKQALLYNRCRKVALAIGSHLVREGSLHDENDVFFLTVPELDELLSGHAMLPACIGEIVAIRKRAHHDAGQSIAPDTFEMAEGRYRANEGTATSRPEPGHVAEMSGTGACGGQTTAPAAVLGSVADAHLLHVGDILVTRQTDPGWAPVFSLIRGLVIERGGMLSHGAIIAREFGLPCVVGVKDAMTRIPQRSLLSIDGDHGHVRILD